MYNRYKISNNKGLEAESNNKKIILNNKNDLINIPIQQLRTAQLKNFCGNLFDRIYEEAMIIEHNQDTKKPNKAFSHELSYRKYNTISLSNGIINSKKFDKNKIKKNTEKKPEKSIKDPQIKKYIEKKPEKAQKSISTEIKKVIKIIKKKVPKKLLPENNTGVKTSPNVINSSIIYKKIHNNFSSEDNKRYNLSLNSNNSMPYYHSINLNMNKDNDYDLNINKIIFSIKYDTIFGEEIGILGSIPKLGNWDQNKIFYLNWNNGNIWIGEFSLESNSFSDFEFKFVISSNRKVKRWENGDNNKVFFDKLLNEVKYKKNGYFNKYEYTYDSNKEELYLKCRWN